MTKKSKGFTARTKARKRAIDVLFEADQRNLDKTTYQLRELLALRQEVTAAQTALPFYSKQIVEGVAEHLSQIDSLIEEYADVDRLDRMPAVDLAALRVGIWEMLGNPDMDPIIAIDEAVSIVKSISTDKSPAFVNAILDNIRKEHKPWDSAVSSSQNHDDSSDFTPDDSEWDELLGEY